MTSGEALSILDQAASTAPLNRQSHIAVQEAVGTLREALAGLKETESVKKPAEARKSASRDGASLEEVPVD